MSGSALTSAQLANHNVKEAVCWLSVSESYGNGQTQDYSVLDRCGGEGFLTRSDHSVWSLEGE